MANRQLEAGRILGEATQAAARNLGVLVAACAVSSVLAIAIWMVIFTLLMAREPSERVFYWVYWLGSGLVYGLAGPTLLSAAHVALRVARGEAPTSDDLGVGWRRARDAGAAGGLYGLASGGLLIGLSHLFRAVCPADELWQVLLWWALNIAGCGLLLHPLLGLVWPAVAAGRSFDEALRYSLTTGSARYLELCPLALVVATAQVLLGWPVSILVTGWALTVAGAAYLAVERSAHPGAETPVREVEEEPEA